MSQKKPEQIFAEDIQTEGWNYFKNQGFDFYIKTQSGYVTTYHPYITKDRTELDAYFKAHNSSGYLEKCYDLEKIITCYSRTRSSQILPTNILEEKQNQTLHLEFFKHCYNSMPQHQKMLLGNYLSFYKDKSLSREEFLFQLVDYLTSSAIKEKTSTLLKFPLSELSLQALSVASIETYLVNNQATKQEVDKFLLSYFKARKNQLKDAKMGTKMRDYLLSKYSHHSEELQLYKTFFPILSAAFDIPTAHFVLNNEPLSTTIIVSAKKMKTSFLLDNWEADHYATILQVLAKGFKTHYNLDRIFIDEIDRTDKSYDITFFHNNPEFNKVIFEQDTIEYFQFLYDQKLEYKQVNIEHFSNWISKKLLHNTLEHLEEKSSASKKIKI